DAVRLIFEQILSVLAQLEKVDFLKLCVLGIENVNNRGSDPPSPSSIASLTQPDEIAWGLERAHERGGRGRGVIMKSKLNRRVRHPILPQKTFSPKISDLECRLARQNVIST
ncbi:hypothetical protein PENTCL1PPCAC_8610, partial [Pristionchus entomophagus]